MLAVFELAMGFADDTMHLSSSMRSKKVCICCESIKDGYVLAVAELLFWPLLFFCYCYSMRSFMT